MEIVADQGRIKISNEVIMMIVRRAVDEVQGIVSFSGGLPGGFTEVFSKRTTTKKGVKITNEETQVVINLSIVIEYGVIIPDVVKKVQESVQKSVESMTDIKVGTVNVLVQDIKV